MSKKLQEVNTLDIYQNRSTLKYFVLTVSLIIGTSSVYYTNLLVEDLKSREKELIQLYAKTLEYAANENNSDNLIFLFQEIIVANNTIPVISTDAYGTPTLNKNLDIPEDVSPQKRMAILRQELRTMKEEHEPIEITLRNSNGEVYDYQYVYYKNSYILTQLQYYPFVQLTVIAVFGIIAFIAFSYSKTAEQNRVWVGLAKETAHQLGTPLSSLMAWVEYFKSEPKINELGITEELAKDVKKLELITARFSNIGSVPILKEEKLYDVISTTINYLQPRISTKVLFKVTEISPGTTAKINKPLFDWVIENLCKNAVDAMSGIGKIDIKIIKGNEGKVFIDISDNGKGMSKHNLKKVFNPGFTTKKRGWGLGLTLVKRIVDNYHKGKIIVKSSVVDEGTTFRIILKA